MTVEFNDLLGIYRSFKTNDDIADKMLQSSRANTTDRPHLESLLKLLFPRAGGFKSNEEFWNGFYTLGLDPAVPSAARSNQIASAFVQQRAKHCEAELDGSKNPPCTRRSGAFWPREIMTAEHIFMLFMQPLPDIV